MVHFVCISFLDFRFLYWNLFFYKFLLSDKRFASGFIWIIHLMDFSVCHFGLRFLSFFFQLTFFFVPGIIFIWSSCRFGLCCICPDYLPSGWALNEGKRIFHLNFMFGSNWILAYTFDLLHSVSLFSADQWRFPFLAFGFLLQFQENLFCVFRRNLFVFSHKPFRVYPEKGTPLSIITCYMVCGKFTESWAYSSCLWVYADCFCFIQGLNPFWKDIGF